MSFSTQSILHLIFLLFIFIFQHYIPSYPVHVRVDMWVQEVTAVSELTQDFEIDLYINEFWSIFDYLQISLYFREDPALVFDYMVIYCTNFLLLK